MAEHLALDQLRRDRAAVDREERLLAAPRQVVQRARRDFLAGAAFARDQDRHGGGGDAAELFIQPQHRRRPAAQLAELGGLGGVVGQRADLGLHRRRLGDTRQHPLELADVDRLDQVVGGAEPQGLDRGLEAGVAGDQHDLGVGADLLVVEQGHAAAVGQMQVEQDEVGTLQRHLAPRLGERVGGGRAQAFAGQQRREHFGRVDVVIDDQSVRHAVSRRGQVEFRGVRQTVGTRAATGDRGHCPRMPRHRLCIFSPLFVGRVATPVPAP